MVGFTEGLWVIQDVAQVEQQRNVVAHHLQREDLYGLLHDSYQLVYILVLFNKYRLMWLINMIMNYALFKISNGAKFSQHASQIMKVTMGIFTVTLYL